MYEHISALQASIHHWVGLSSDFFLYEHWQGPWFEKDQWEKLTKGTRIFLCMATALLLIYEVRARRLREKIKERTRRRVAWLLTGAAFFVYFDFFNPNVRYEEYYHRHEFYHYYLGSKYSEELGYIRLYECSMIAEIELGRKANVLKREVRDLRENLIKPVQATYIATDPDQCKKHFSPPRWEAFKQDIDWFQKSAAGSYWEGMQKDHGYNPPPVWTMTGKFFGSFAPAGDTYFKLLACIDILFHVGIVLLFNWAFGWRAMTVATVFWGCNAPANFYWTGGAFLRMDWIFLLVASLCLMRRRRFFLAGFALTWAMLLRIFPGLFIAGVIIVMALVLIDRIRKARASGKAPKNLLEYIHPDHRRFIAGCFVCVAVLVPASMMATGGTGAYKEFYEHTLKTHAGTPLTNTMGLQTMLVHDWNGRMRFTRDDNLDDPFQGWKQGRLDRFKQMKPVFIGIILAVFAWTVWALRRTKLLWVGLAISTPLVICLTNVTCYYYSMTMVSCALVIARRQIGPPMLITSGVSQILLYAPNGYYWVDDRYTAQSWLFFTMGIILLFVYSRPFSMQRLKAWWNGEPEPKGKWKIFESTPPAKPTATPAE
jgi:hypothetical protein